MLQVYTDFDKVPVSDSVRVYLMSRYTIPVGKVFIYTDTDNILEDYAAANSIRVCLVRDPLGDPMGLITSLLENWAEFVIDPEMRMPRPKAATMPDYQRATFKEVVAELETLYADLLPEEE